MITAEQLHAMDADERRVLIASIAPRIVDPYVPHVPHPPQIAYLLQDGPEAFYGGAAGGGKSDALLMAATQYVDVPGYSALILRRTFSDLTLPGAIMDRADEWFRGTEAWKRGGKTWHFPTADPTRPARITFGYLMYHKDVEQYRGAEFQAICIDESTQFEKRTYEFLFSRLRGPALTCLDCGHPASKIPGAPWLHDEGHDEDCGCGRRWWPSPSSAALHLLKTDDDGRPVEELRTARPDRSSLAAASDGLTLADVPLRMRSASNPGGVGHAWHRDHFVAPPRQVKGRSFVPAKIEDNPSLDRRAYRASLSHLGPLELARLEQGDWDVADEGDVFDRAWFTIVADIPRDRRLEFCRFWDLAATAERRVSKRKTNDPDWTVGALLGMDPKTRMAWIIDVVRFRKAPREVEAMMQQTAVLDRNAYGPGVRVRYEEEGGSSGKITTAHLSLSMAGHDFDGARTRENKIVRARPVASSLQAGNLPLVEGSWNGALIDEFSGFPTGAHDDQVDGVSGAYAELAFGKRARVIA